MKVASPVRGGAEGKGAVLLPRQRPTPLYAGETARDIAARKGLKRGQAILDHMGSEELAANLFRDDTRLFRVAQDDRQLAIDLGELGLEGIREEAERPTAKRATAPAPGSGRCGGAVHGGKRCARETDEPPIL